MRPRAALDLLLGALTLLAAASCVAPGASEYVRLKVRGRPQARSLSCESRSACDLLGFYGVAVVEDRFRAGLPRSDNPERGFVGDVDGPGGQLPPHGYGVYEVPIAARIRDYGLDASAVRGRDLAWLRAQLAAGRPVIVWATIGLDAPRTVIGTDREGDTYTAVRGEHTFLAIGFSAGDLFLLDPALSETKRVSAHRFDRSWAVLGRRAVVVTSAEGGGPPSSARSGR